MLQISVSLENGPMRAKLEKLADAVRAGAFDQPVEIAAWKAEAALVELTPKKWTGMTRKSWSVKKVTAGSRLIFNSSKVMLFLEGGTGQSTGGYIYPRNARLLYIPLNVRASYGWQKGFVFGKDYVLAKRVKGIQARNIVRDYTPKAMALLKDEMKQFLRRVMT